MPTTAAVTVLASEARTTSDVGAGVDLGIKATAELLLNVTAVAGTLPTLLVTLETSRDNATGWRTVTPTDDTGASSSYSSKNSATSQRVVFAGCDRYVRARWVIGGTGGPSFTFSVAGDAVLVYCTPDDLEQLGLPAAALTKVGTAWKDKSAQAITDTANSYLRQQHELPLTSIDGALRRACAAMTAADVMVTRGLEPEQQEELLFKRAEAALAWLREIAAGEAALDSAIDTTPEEEEGGVYAYSDARRGW